MHDDEDYEYLMGFEEALLSVLAHLDIAAAGVLLLALATRIAGGWAT